MSTHNLPILSFVSVYWQQLLPALGWLKGPLVFKDRYYKGIGVALAKNTQSTAMVVCVLYEYNTAIKQLQFYGFDTMTIVQTGMGRWLKIVMLNPAVCVARVALNHCIAGSSRM